MPLDGEWHHTWPRFLGGPDDQPLVFLCDTTHSNVHIFLRMMVRHGPIDRAHMRAVVAAAYGKVAPDVVISEYAWDMAVDGYRQWRASQPAAVDLLA